MNTRLPLACMAFAVFSAASLNSSAATLLFDFGANTSQMEPIDDPTFAWNNVPISVASNSAGQLFDFVTTENVPTDIDLMMIARFNGANENGTLASTLYPSDATRDSLYGNTELFGGLTNIFPEFKLTSLDPLKTYDFTFYASRTGTSDNRETQYTVTGAATGIVYLNVANNINNQITLFGMAPDANGEITIRLNPGPANNNANHFTYLGVLKVDVIPEPSSAVLLLGGTSILGFIRRRKA